MAEGLIRRFGAGEIEAASAGLRPGSGLAEYSRTVMGEIGVDLSGHQPRPLEAVEGPVDVVISLCEVIAPGQDLFPHATRLRWRIPDPIGGPLEEYRETRDRIWDHLRPYLQQQFDLSGLPERLDQFLPDPKQK